MGNATESCANPACGCPAQTMGDYCSEECGQSASEAESKCRCGHARCGGE